MKILHLANWNSTNIGNGALIYGSEKAFEEDFPGEVEFIPEAWDDYTFKRKFFDESFVHRVNSSADALMVNGAVTFNAFRRGMKNTGMRFDLPLELWDQIEVPIILYGLSYRCWPFQQYPNLKAFKEFIQYAIDHENVFFGVRNDGTKEWIARTCGIESDQIHEVPDPGLFVPFDTNEKYPELDPDKKNVIIAFNGEDAEYRYATPLQKVVWKITEPLLGDVLLEKIFKRIHFFNKPRKKTVKKIARAVEEIGKKNQDIQFILAPHYLDDYGMIQEFIEEVYEQLAHQRMVTSGLLSVPHTSYFYGRYKQADLVLAMRVHSMSPSIGLGTPVIPITSQGRMRHFLRKMNLSDIGVDIKDDNFVEMISEKVSNILENSSPLRSKLNNATTDARTQMRENNKIILDLIAKRRSSDTETS